LCFHLFPNMDKAQLCLAVGLAAGIGIGIVVSNSKHLISTSREDDKEKIIISYWKVRQKQWTKSIALVSLEETTCESVMYMMKHNWSQHKMIIGIKAPELKLILL
jgi:hypothetical protein